MPQPHPLPKKYLAVLDAAQTELRILAQRARTALEEVEAEEHPFQLTRMILRDIEAEAYRLALELATLEVTGACDGCPSAPPTTHAQALLLVMADELERQAQMARAQAQGRTHPLASGNGSATKEDGAVGGGPCAKSQKPTDNGQWLERKEAPTTTAQAKRPGRPRKDEL